MNSLHIHLVLRHSVEISTLKASNVKLNSDVLDQTQVA